VTGAGGVLGWQWLSGPDLLSGMTVDTLYFEGDALTDDQSYGPESERRWADGDVTVLDDAESETDSAERVREFVTETDFDDAYVVVAQYEASSDAELTLEAIERRRDGLSVTVAVDYPSSGSTDATPHSLLVRVRDKNGDVPETVELTVDD